MNRAHINGKSNPLRGMSSEAFWRGVFLTFCLMPALCLAQAGQLDSTFGQDGVVTTDFFATNDFARAVAIQADGKIVVAGGAVSIATSSDFAVVRYNPDGSLDTSFGVDGRVTADFRIFHPSWDVAYDVAVQPDGKILVAGEKLEGLGLGWFALARYQPDGTLDADFGSGGKLLFRGPSLTSIARSVALQGDGSILVTGSAYQVEWRLLVARFDVNGALDRSFSGSGYVVLPDMIFGADMAVGNDRLYIAGRKRATGGNVSNFGVAGLTYAGQLDPMFGVDGIAETVIVIDGITTGGDPVGVAIQTEEGGSGIETRIVVGGAAAYSGGSLFIALAGFDMLGNLDVGFGIGGTMTTDLNSSGGDIEGMARHADGKVVLAGWRKLDTATPPEFVLARYERDGNIDIGFGFGDVVTTSIGSEDRAHDVAIQADAKVVVVGGSLQTTHDFAAARYEGISNPEQSVGVLIEEIQELVSDGTLSNGEGAAAQATLQASMLQLERNNLTAALQTLNAFIIQIQAFVQGNILAEDQALPLIQAANAIIAMIEAELGG